MFTLHNTSHIQVFYFILSFVRFDTFPVIDPVCYKLAKKNRRKEEPRTNKTDMFSTKNSTQNG